MAVMLMATIPGQNTSDQRAMVERLRDELRERDGFVFHGAGRVDGGWRLHESWETLEQLDAWLADRIFPALSSDAPKPEMEILSLDAVVTP